MDFHHSIFTVNIAIIFYSDCKLKAGDLYLYDGVVYRAEW